MSHLKFVFAILSANMGIIALISGFVILTINRSRETLYRLIMTSGFLLIIITFAVNQYQINMKIFNYIPNHIPSVGIFILIVFLVFYTDEVIGVKRKAVKIFFVTLSIISFLSLLSSIFLNTSTFITILVSTIGLGLSILYTSLHFIFYKFTCLTTTIRNIKRLIGIFALILLPVFIAIDIFNNNRGLNGVTIFFIFWGTTLLYEDILSYIYVNKESRIEGFTNDKGLTPREHEIMIQLIKGYKYKDIAENLFISKETVKTHVKNIYSKCKVGNKVQLMHLIEPYI